MSGASSCMSSMVNIANKIDNVGLSQEKSIQGGWGYTFLTPCPSLLIEILVLSLCPKKFQPFTSGNSAKLCDTSWKFQGKKPRPIEITWFVLVHPWKFHFFFNWPLEFPHVLSSIPLEIPCPQPTPLFGFFS